MKGYIFLSLIILVFSLKEDGLGSHFATNPNNQYGKEKTITIDGTSSGWELDMKIAQSIANNDPRVLLNLQCMKLQWMITPFLQPMMINIYI